MEICSCVRKMLELVNRLIWHQLRMYQENFEEYIYPTFHN
jgi:hypothetical protein